MPESESVWQRILINVVAPITAAAILGLYALALDLSRSMAVVQSQIADMRAERGSQYTKAEIDQRNEEIFRTNQHQYGLIEDHEKRIRANESLLSQLIGAKSH